MRSREDLFIDHGRNSETCQGEPAQRIAKAYHYPHPNRVGKKDFRVKLGEEGKRLR